MGSPSDANASFQPSLHASLDELSPLSSRKYFKKSSLCQLLRMAPHARALRSRPYCSQGAGTLVGAGTMLPLRPAAFCTLSAGIYHQGPNYTMTKVSSVRFQAQLNCCSLTSHLLPPEPQQTTTTLIWWQTQGNLLSQRQWVKREKAARSHVMVPYVGPGAEQPPPTLSRSLSAKLQYFGGCSALQPSPCPHAVPPRH